MRRRRAVRRERRRRGKRRAGQRRSGKAAARTRQGGARDGMNPSRLFILRPVATSLLMVAILLAGIVAYRVLPLSALPEVDYPTIQVVTLYPGASPDVMTSSITAPLERQFGQMPGLNQMSSTSSGGASVITLQFSLDLTLDVAEQEVQAAINAAANLLPTDLPTPPIYSKVNPADAPILTLAVTSHDAAAAEGAGPRRHAPRAEDLAAPRRRPGQHRRRPAAGGAHPGRIRRRSPRTASSLDDLRTAIANANVNQAKGSFDGPTRASTIDANDQLKSADEYQQSDHRVPNGAPVRLADVADVVDGAENTRLAAWVNDTPAIILNVQRQPGANVIEVVDRDQAAAAAAAGDAAGRGRRDAADRPHDDDPRLGAATCSSSCCSPSRWSCW